MFCFVVFFGKLPATHQIWKQELRVQGPLLAFSDSVINFPASQSFSFLVFAVGTFLRPTILACCKEEMKSLV